VTSEREKAARALRRSVRLEQRRARQLSGIEEVGRLLAVGPTREALEHVVEVLRREFGYRYVSIYLDRGDGTFELGAQRGYETMIDTFDGSYGIVGRVIRTGQAELVVDVSTDPDYVSANPNVVSEVCAPLLDGVSVLGVVNVESVRSPLDDADRKAVVAIADRLAAYVALGRERRRLADLSARDPLTGLLNRRSLEERVTNVFSERASADPAVRRPLALVLFDLDHFGRLNKDHGHALGDEVLRQFGELLARQFRSSDVVARYGGEEFVAILDGAGLEEATSRAELVRQALEADAFEVSSGPLHVTVSAGCAELLAAQVGSWSDLMAASDVALGMAKRAGRNQVVSASV
jgi:diguanylate cyclase (GGDEF)-like protein